MIRKVYHSWPENHEHAFSSSEELRAYLQMKAGHKEMVADIPLSGVPKERVKIIVEAAIRATGSYAFPVVHRERLIIFKPKSIAFDRLSHAQAVGLFNEVEAVIKAEAGIDPEQLMQSEEHAA